jgi:hypothetical protein
VILEDDLTAVSFEKTRPNKTSDLESCLSDSRGGVGGLGTAAGSCRVIDMCPRGTMTAISRNERDKLHRDAVFHPVLLQLHAGPKYGSAQAWSDVLGRLPKRAPRTVNAFASR